jgi:hypothetical protein
VASTGDVRVEDLDLAVETGQLRRHHAVDDRRARAQVTERGADVGTPGGRIERRRDGAE